MSAVRIARWASQGAAILLGVALLMAPGMPLAQGLNGAAAVSNGVAAPLGLDSPRVSNLSSKDSAEIGMTAAPGLIKAAQLPCTLSHARLMFEAAGADKQKAKVYEVACQEGPGYVIIDRQKAGAVPAVVDCMATTLPVRGRPGPWACELAGNADPVRGLSGAMARSGYACAVDKGRYLGSTNDQDVYEVSCGEGRGYILQAAKAPGGDVTAISCPAFGADSNLKCILQTPEQQLTAITTLIAASGKPCVMTNKRYLGPAAAHHVYLEVACSSGKGYVLEVGAAGELAAATDCLLAAGIAGGCTLSDTRQAQIAPNGPYSDLARETYGDLAKSAGFDCAVSKYADFPPKPNGAEVVELACSNRPDGVVAVFPSTGRAEVWDCLRAQAEGYMCSFSPDRGVYGKLTTQLKAKGANCEVNDARAYGRTSQGGDQIEVACAGGGSGWVLEYPPHVAEPTGALRDCAQAAASGGGGCQLAANKAHG